MGQAIGVGELINFAAGIFEHAYPEVGKRSIFLRCLMVLTMLKTFEATARQAGNILVYVIVMKTATHVNKAVIIERATIWIEGVFVLQLIDQ